VNGNRAGTESDEMLPAVLGRLAMIEASVQGLTCLLFTHVLSATPGEPSVWSPEALADVVGECRDLVLRTQLQYFEEQFPGKAKILREHVGLPEIDLRECFRKLIEKSKRK